MPGHATRSHLRRRSALATIFRAMAVAMWARPEDLLAFQPEQQMLIHGVSRKDYVIMREAVDTPGLRMTFCEGVP